MDFQVFLPLLVIAVLLNSSHTNYSELNRLTFLGSNYSFSILKSLFSNQMPQSDACDLTSVHLVKSKDDSEHCFRTSKESYAPKVASDFPNQNSSVFCAPKESSERFEIVSFLVPGYPKTIGDDYSTKINVLQSKSETEIHFMRFEVCLFFGILFLLLLGITFLMSAIISHLLNRLKAMETKLSQVLVENSKLIESGLEEEAMNRESLEALEQKLKEYEKRYVEEHRQLVEVTKMTELLKMEYDSVLQELEELEANDEESIVTAY